MDIEKLKAEFEQSECFKKLEHVAQYTFFEFGAYIKRTDVPDDVEKKCEHLITALIFSWKAWREAKAQAVPKGFVLVAIDDIERICRCLDDHAVYITYKASDALESIQKAMIEAQELANESE